MKLHVHFDYVKIGNDLQVGAVVLDDGEIIHSKLESFEDVVDKGNNYHFTLLSWVTGIKALREFINDEGDVYDGVTFLNQNELIFRWVQSGKFPDTYKRVIGNIHREINLLKSEVDMFYRFKKIEGRHNEVKKLLKKRKKKVESKVEKEEIIFGDGYVNTDSEQHNIGKVISIMDKLGAS